MWFLIILGALGALVAGIGTAQGLRRRRTGDYSERLDPRDVPGRGHTDGQAAAGVSHHVRSSGSAGWSI
ncbi:MULTISPECIES: hypothetical protein [Herbiconiux]|uniref:Uncharacterized protein n=2 Tax=Herbiconiux TaxID=881616 RepID=A0A852SJ32_9MICO|nr:MULTISPECIES: hypothetical protein [Herbiconiux]MCS5714082.1 hypothetical protein [Herbiconiux gentiana]NYD69283.1 hypothetical protein [Herbiconiux flava]GLK16029.1 hypothetical protein GCM10017602_05110 [Herbiconiux flava]